MRLRLVWVLVEPASGNRERFRFAGALYRACNWWWAPTWHRLRPPPTGNGTWSEGRQEAVKDRWVFPLAPDAERAAILRAQDEAILRKWPWAEYREPGGVPFKRFAQTQDVGLCV